MNEDGRGNIRIHAIRGGKNYCGKMWRVAINNITLKVHPPYFILTLEGWHKLADEKQ